MVCHRMQLTLIIMCIRIITCFTTAGARNGESRAAALSNTETGEVIDAYAVGGSNIALTGGPPREQLRSEQGHRDQIQQFSGTVIV